MDQNQSNFEDYAEGAGQMLSKNAAYYRTRARESLRGKWKRAILLAFLAILLGGVIAGGVTYQANFNFDVEYTDFANHPYLDGVVLDGAFLLWIVKAMITVFLLAASFWILVSLFVSSPVKLGYQRANLDLVDGVEPEVKTLFGYFKTAYARSIVLNLLYSLVTTIVVAVPAVATAAVTYGMVFDFMELMEATDPTVHFVMPEIDGLLIYLPILLLLVAITCAALILCWILHYSYRFAYMVMAEYPTMGAVEAMRVSRTMMKGRKWKLFCLDLSFIGWAILSALTFGIGFFFLCPYREAAFAAFYHDAAHRDAAKETEFPSLNFDDYFSDEDTSFFDRSVSSSSEETKEEEVEETEPSNVRTDGTSPFGGSLFFPSLDLNDYNDDEGELFHKPMRKKKDDENRPL